MTYLNLDSDLDRLESLYGFNDTNILDSLKALPFYNWNNSNDSITFNHAIGLPQKDGKTYPLFDYEKLLYDTLQNNKLLWVLKATGLGVTEFILRYMCWLCLRDDTYRDAQMPIVCGPNQDIAIKLIKRIKAMFEPLGILFDTKETVVVLNGCTIEAFPSNHLDAYRSLTNPKFIFLDEADFFRPSDQLDARSVSERYLAKSNPWIVMVSTPNAPNGLFESIQKEEETTCLYKRLFLDYTYGLNKIYTTDEIAKAKRAPSFEREYNLKYLGLIGNILHIKDIEEAVRKGQSRIIKFTESEVNLYSAKSVGLDPGFGSSNFGVCITELVDGIANVLHAEEYTRPSFDEMINLTVGLCNEYNIRFDNGCRVFVDGANPSFIRTLKERLYEDSNYEQQIQWLKKTYPTVYDLQFLQQNMFVIPVPFAKEHKSMLAHVKELMEYNNGYVAINPKHNKLITSLRTAVENGEGSLDKDATSFDDCFDSFRLSLIFWH